jgi:cyclase
MLTTRIVPCLDVAAGRVVKGVQFQGLQDVGDPVECAHAYELQGADEIVLLDVAATPEGRGHALELVRRVRQVLSIPLTVGGGVRTLEDAGALLDAGADKVSVNSAAVRRPQLLREMAARFGRQCTVLAIDARHGRAGYEVLIRSGEQRTGMKATQWAALGERLGAGEILLTSWDRDGTGIGYDLELLRRVRRVVRVPIVASGGAKEPEHFAAGVRAGANALLAAGIFHRGEVAIGTLKETLQRTGLEMRR